MSVPSHSTSHTSSSWGPPKCQYSRRAVAGGCESLRKLFCFLGGDHYIYQILCFPSNNAKNLLGSAALVHPKVRHFRCRPNSGQTSTGWGRLVPLEPEKPIKLGFSFTTTQFRLVVKVFFISSAYLFLVCARSECISDFFPVACVL